MYLIEVLEKSPIKISQEPCFWYMSNALIPVFHAFYSTEFCRKVLLSCVTESVTDA